MRVFILVLDTEGVVAASAVETKLKEAEIQFFKLSPSAFVIASDMLSNDIAVAAGIKGDARLEDASGVVFRMDSYSGYTNRALWEWIGKAED